jgi:hypothetical protein
MPLQEGRCYVERTKRPLGMIGSPSNLIVFGLDGAARSELVALNLFDQRGSVQVQQLGRLVLDPFGFF